MNVNLFVLQYASAQIFTNNCFCKVLFQAQTEAGSPALQADSLPTKLSGKPFFQTQCNLITSWMKNRQSKGLWWITLFFPICVQMTLPWTWQTPLPVWRSHTGTRYYVYVLPGTQRHWTLSLRQTEHICSGESMPHAALQSALGIPGLHLLW